MAVTKPPSRMSTPLARTATTPKPSTGRAVSVAPGTRTGTSTGTGTGQPKSSSNKKRPKSKSTKSKNKIKIKKVHEDPEIVHTLIECVKSGDIDGVHHLLTDAECKGKFNLYSQASDAVVQAAALGFVDILCALIEWGTTNHNTVNQLSVSTSQLANIQCGKPIQRAALYGHLECVEALHAKYGADLLLTTEFTLTSCLHYAAQHGRTSVVQYIVTHVTPRRACAALIDACTHTEQNGVHNGWSALHYAADNGHLDTVKLLVQAGATVDIMTATNDTPASLAAEHGKWSVVEYLVLQGCEINAVRRQLTLVHWAVYRAAHDAVQFLVSRGAALSSMDALQTVTAKWLQPGETLYSIVRSEFSEAVYRQIDLAVYRGLKVQRDGRERVECIQGVHWVDRPTAQADQSSIFEIGSQVKKVVKHKLPDRAVSIILQYDTNA